MLLHHAAALDDLLGKVAAEAVADVVQIRRVPDDEVAELARLDRTDLVSHVDGRCAVERYGGQHLLGRKPILQAAEVDDELHIQARAGAGVEVRRHRDKPASTGGKEHERIETKNKRKRN